MILNLLGYALISFFMVDCGGVSEQESAVPVSAAAPDQASTVDRDQNLSEFLDFDRVFFGFDSSSLTLHSKDTLNKQVKWLENQDTNIEIEGHTDKSGTREYNLALGERRANVVKDYLELRGITSGRISVISYGKERPLDISSNAAARAKNRRAVTVIQSNK